MQAECVNCHRLLDFAAERPSFCAFCGQPLPPSDVSTTPDPGLTSPAGPPLLGPELPETIGGYRLVRRIGSGGMGTVCEAEEPASGRRVAIKLISPRYASSSEALERFRREGRLASAVSHPRCVFVYAADEDAGRPYLVLELMPGETLQDQVRQRSPLPVRDAIGHVLEIIDGLQEVHRLGVVHRDVKPSNCFLDAEGHVKLGDFGLARSLAADAHLTRTGAFVGTPLFAPPEQLKGAVVDFRSDVYAVAATLYYLLSGKAPHEGGDSAAVAARIASEPARPLRTLRPDLPAALEAVVMRGLERQPERRWQDVAQLREALEPFISHNLTPGGMGLRMAAYLLDWLLLWVVVLLVQAFTESQIKQDLGRSPLFSETIRSFLILTVPDLIYFGLLEGLWGRSLGKWAFRLRVRRGGGEQRAGFLRATLRALVFCTLIYVPVVVVPYLPLPCIVLITLDVLMRLRLGGLPLIVIPMRARNGYRGTHEFASDTQVIELPAPDRPWATRSVRERLDEPLVMPDDAPRQVGPFRVEGALRQSADEQVLLGVDEGLERRVLLWLRSAAAAVLGRMRREVARLTRLRWLSHGQDGPMHWDAFVAPTGAPLPEVVGRGGPLPWRESRALFVQLADELAAACADGTLPATLRSDQVWIGPGGQVKLLDMPVVAGPAVPAAAEDVRALALLREVASLALEGRPPSAPPAPPQVPLPVYAIGPLARLFGAGPGYERIADFKADLEAMRERPADIGRRHRLVHVAIQTSLLLLGIVLMLLLSIWLWLPKPWDVAILFVGPLVGAPLAFATRGASLTDRLARTATVTANGGLTGRWRSAWRAFLSWLEAVGAFLGGTFGARWLGRALALKSAAGFDALWFGFLAVMLWQFLTAWVPRRPLNDFLSGTYLVPR